MLEWRVRVVCDWGWSEERMECVNGERVVSVNGERESSVRLGVRVK